MDIFELPIPLSLKKKCKELVKDNFVKIFKT